MTKSHEENIANACHAIATELFDSANRVPEGYYWKTLHSAGRGAIDWQEHESLYHGVSGIAYFLMEYGARFQKPEYEQLAADALLACAKATVNQEGPLSYAFFTGRLGLIYTLKLAQHRKLLTDEVEPLVAELSAELPNYSKNPPPVDDVINGNAGTVLGLLKLYEIDKSTFWLDAAEALAHNLLQRAYFSKTGLFWDRTANTIHGLCGFSHGACGVAHTFLELYRATKNETWRQLALSGLHHERQFYVPKWGNWQDLRKSFMEDSEREKLMDAFYQGNKSHFMNGVDMSAWCHGAAGAILPRLYHQKHLADYPYLQEEIENGLLQIEARDVNDASRVMQILCHGHAGNGSTLITAYNLEGASKYLNLAHKLAEKTIEEAAERGNYRCGYGAPETVSDTSLFMGDAGVGWYFLRCLFPQEVADVMCPTYDGPAVQSHFQYSTAEAWQHIVSKYPVSKATVTDLPFQQSTVASALPKDTAEVVAFDAKQPSFAWNYAHLVASSQEKLNAEQHYMLPGYVRFIDGERYQLQISEGSGTRILDLPDLAGAIVWVLSQGKRRPNEVVASVLEAFEVDAAEREQLQQMVQQQMQELLSAGYVVPEKFEQPVSV